MGPSRIYTDEERKQRAVEAAKRWQERNPEKTAAIGIATAKRWRKDNRDRYNAYQREYAAEVRRVRKTLERREAV